MVLDVGGLMAAIADGMTEVVGSVLELESQERHVPGRFRPPRLLNFSTSLLQRQPLISMASLML